MDQKTFNSLDKISHEQKASLLRSLRWDTCCFHFILFIWAIEAALKIGAGTGTFMNYAMIVFVLISFVFLYFNLGKLKLFILDEEARGIVEKIIKSMMDKGEIDIKETDDGKVVKFPCGTPVKDKPGGDPHTKCEECPETCEECKTEKQ